MRLFVGIPVNAGPRLAAAVREVGEQAPSARLVAPGKWHVTLRFLGEVPDPAPLEMALREGLRDAAPVEGTLRGVGGFPDIRRARVAWAGVVAEGLPELAQRVRAATETFGVPETHPFAGHVTLARLPRPQDLAAWCARHAAQEWGPFTADRVVLYRSRPGRDADAAYETLARFPLGAPHVP